MALVRLILNFQDRKFKIKCVETATVRELLIKIRQFLKMRPESAIFLFFETTLMGINRQVIFTQTKTLAEIQQEVCRNVLTVNILKENCFGFKSMRNRIIGSI